MKRSLSLLLPWLVGVVALAVAYGLALHEQGTQERSLRVNFEIGLRQAATRIEQRIASYELVLRGTQGLFNAADEVDAEDFGVYVDALLAGADAAGLQAIGYAPVGAQGADGAPVRYIAPASGQNRQLLGLDLQHEPLLRAAMLQARDSGGIAITRQLRLPGDPELGPHPAFYVFLPTYVRGQSLIGVEQRRRQHRGWVFASFRMSDLMSSLYGDGMPGLALRVHDGVGLGADTLMFRSGAPAQARPRFEAQEYIGFAGHTWTLVVSTTAAFEALHSLDTPRIILVAGIVASLLLALLTLQLVSGRERAHAVAQAMTKELRESEERYRRIVQTAAEGIWMLDPRHATSFVNPKLLAMLGYPEADLLGQPMTRFIDEPGRVLLELFLGRGAAAAPEHHELRLRRRDGSDLWVSLSMNPIVDATGLYAGTLAMVTDISAAKQAEARRQVLEAQLRESQKMEAIGTLAGGIAHDFNNILAAILGNASLARDGLPADGPAAQHLAQVLQAGAHARNLVQQIVAFSRRQPLARVSQPLQPLLQDTVALLRATLPAAVSLQSQVAPAPVWARIDANQLQQVLMNLGTNAWHALQGQPGGAGRIELGLDAVQLDAEAVQSLVGLKPGPHAHLWVADTGTGMDEATLARIFEPFFTTKPVGEGTGLGLSVVHGIVAAHQGAIAVASQPGEGTRFDLYFPAVEPGVPPPVPAPVVVHPGRGERLLYVDDDAVMVMLVEALLERAGYAVRCFGDARAALAAVRADPEAFELVITDYNMPALSGLDVVRELHALRPGLPVIISSGYLSEDIRAAARAAGVQHLLQKEYSAEQLVPLVQRVLEEAAADQNRK